MESTGEVGRIHISASTTELLRAAGKGRWVSERKDLVEVKGKGTMRTFWLNQSPNKSDNKGSSDNESISPSDFSRGEKLVDDTSDAESIKRGRLIDWIVELLLEHVKNLVSGVQPNMREWIFLNVLILSFHLIFLEAYSTERRVAVNVHATC
jgi:Adenylate and Guanylate cyclase catalytic domain